MKYILCLFLVLLPFMVSCQSRNAVGCETLQSVLLPETEFNTLTPGTITTWISETQSVLGDVTIATPENYRTPVADVDWRTPYGNYQGEFKDGSILYMMWHTPPFENPTAAEIVDCFGAPDYYRALYVTGAKQFELLLIYTKRGFIVGTSTLTFFREPPRNIRDTTTYSIKFVRSGDLESVLDDAYPGSGTFNLENSHPWSGNWDEIVIFER